MTDRKILRQEKTVNSSNLCFIGISLDKPIWKDLLPIIFENLDFIFLLKIRTTCKFFKNVIETKTKIFSQIRCFYDEKDGRFPKIISNFNTGYSFRNLVFDFVIYEDGELEKEFRFVTFDILFDLYKGLINSKRIEKMVFHACFCDYDGILIMGLEKKFKSTEEKVTQFFSQQPNLTEIFLGDCSMGFGKFKGYPWDNKCSYYLDCTCMTTYIKSLSESLKSLSIGNMLIKWDSLGTFTLKHLKNLEKFSIGNLIERIDDSDSDDDEMGGKEKKISMSDHQKEFWKELHSMEKLRVLRIGNIGVNRHVLLHLREYFQKGFKSLKKLEFISLYLEEEDKIISDFEEFLDCLEKRGESVLLLLYNNEGFDNKIAISDHIFHEYLMYNDVNLFRGKGRLVINDEVVKKQFLKVIKSRKCVKLASTLPRK